MAQSKNVRLYSKNNKKKKKKEGTEWLWMSESNGRAFV
jgi:hypothetical protein